VLQDQAAMRIMDRHIGAWLAVARDPVAFLDREGPRPVAKFPHIGSRHVTPNRVLWWHHASRSFSRLTIARPMRALKCRLGTPQPSSGALGSFRGIRGAPH
jgi:hypothetical protein